MKQYLYYHKHFNEYYTHTEKQNLGINIELIGEVSEIVSAYQNNKSYKSPYNNSVTSHCKCGLVKNGIQMCLRTDCDHPNSIKSITKI